jgi:hypothetical protein
MAHSRKMVQNSYEMEITSQLQTMDGEIVEVEKEIDKNEKDKSYDSHFDTLKDSIKSTHDTAQDQYMAIDADRKAAVAKEESSDVWRGVKDPKVHAS